MNLIDLFKTGNSNIVRPYIIAEVGVNHEGCLDTAYKLIEEAKEGGANAVKFQTYKAEKIASINSPAYWDTSKEEITSQYKLFKKHDKFWKKEFEKLKIYCDNTDIKFISTPFDVESATFLNDLMDVFKISSSDITNKPFIEFICEFGKPIILSTGASYLYEIQEAVDWIDQKKIPLSLLHCILNYPTEEENAHLGMISSLKKKFPEKLIGYSDHTLPKDMKVLEIATLLGAVILEKHFTNNKKLPGNDHYHAMDKQDLRKFIINIDRIMHLVGQQSKFSLDSESVSRDNARRSLVSNCQITKGQIITEELLTWKRPAYGISPKEIGKVINKKAVEDIPEDEIIKWNMLDS